MLETGLGIGSIEPAPGFVGWCRMARLALALSVVLTLAAAAPAAAVAAQPPVESTATCR